MRRQKWIPVNYKKKRERKEKIQEKQPIIINEEINRFIAKEYAIYARRNQPKK